MKAFFLLNLWENGLYANLKPVLAAFLIFLIVFPILCVLFYYKKWKPDMQFRNWVITMFVSSGICYVFNLLLAFFKTKVFENNPIFVLFLFTTPFIYSVLVFVIASVFIKDTTKTHSNIPWRGKLPKIGK